MLVAREHETHSHFYSHTIIYFSYIQYILREEMDSVTHMILEVTRTAHVFTIDAHQRRFKERRPIQAAMIAYNRLVAKGYSTKKILITLLNQI